jgi:hypothetical protein
MKHRSDPLKPEVPSIEEIERFVEDAGSDDLPTFGGTHEGGIYIQQIPDEIAPCIHAMLAAGEPVRSYFELGVAAGGMTYLAMLLSPADVVLLGTGEHPRCQLPCGPPGLLHGGHRKSGDAITARSPARHATR